MLENSKEVGQRALLEAANHIHLGFQLPNIPKVVIGGMGRIHHGQKRLTSQKVVIGGVGRMQRCQSCF